MKAEVASPSSSPSPPPSLPTLCSQAYRIALVSDFFYPNVGGAELHQYHLADLLVKRGHSVILITHAYGRRAGVRYLTSGLKVFYLPQRVLYNQSSFPNLFSSLPLFRSIVVRERIQIVHGHGVREKCMRSV